MKVEFKVKLEYDKKNNIRAAIAIILAIVMYVTIGFHIGVLVAYGLLYYLIKSLKIDLDQRCPWIWTAILFVGGAIFTTFSIQYMLLDSELFQRMSDLKWVLNVLCCLVVYLVVQLFTNNAGLSCIISHVSLLSFAFINYFVYLFRGNEFAFSDIRSIGTGLSVAGNYKLQLNDRGAYAIFGAALFIAVVRKCHVKFAHRWQMSIIDVMLAAYALNPQRPSFDADELCAQFGVQDYNACPAYAVHRLAERQRAQLRENDLTRVYSEIEFPLAHVLRDMEREGFLVDADALREMGADFDRTIARLLSEIEAEMGRKINLNSPKQLGEMLFDQMGLPAPKKTKTGYSTSAEVLENLAQDYPICAKILEYRKYQKLRSTYIDSLIDLRDDQGRIHTHFEQVATATGRLSSTEPNLQNIPVRTEIGSKIRAAFIARPGWTLVDADYSQIELRVLAHISGDETMIRAFNAGEDIHARTAAEVYGVPLNEVTHQMRSACKAVNFGIVYGISDFALAKNIGVSRAQARDFMDRYFERYPGVKAYMEESVREGRERGYALTLLGRRRYLPELASSNFNVRSFGERCAMNSPIQGTAADIIKIAMIRVHSALRARGMRTRLILQVHVELILEAPMEEAQAAQALLRECMEGVMELKVPLRTDIQTGGDWRACK